MRIDIGLVVLTGVALAGCSAEQRGDPVNAATPTLAPVASAAALPAAEAPVPAAAAGNATAAAECRGVAVAIEPGGLLLLDCDSGRTSPLAIGADASRAIAALDRAFGRPGRTSRMEECGAGPMDAIDWPNGIQVRVAEGRMIGWSLDRAGITTMNGIGVGSTRRALEDGFDASITETTLGTEFSVGDDPDRGLGGLIEGTGGNARITSLWAGTTCHFT